MIKDLGTGTRQPVSEDQHLGRRKPDWGVRLGVAVLLGLGTLLGGQQVVQYRDTIIREAHVKGFNQAKEFYEERASVNPIVEAPEWVQRYAQGFCDGKDIEFLAEHTSPVLGDYDTIRRTMDNRLAAGNVCDEKIDYRGSYKRGDDTKHIYIMSIGNDRNYWVFTTKDEIVLDIE